MKGATKTDERDVGWRVQKRDQAIQRSEKTWWNGRRCGMVIGRAGPWRQACREYIEGMYLEAEETFEIRDEVAGNGAIVLIEAGV